MNFAEVLAHFKSQAEAQAEHITPLVEDAVLRNGVVAWKSMIMDLSKVKVAEQCPHKDDAAMWRWMWTKVTYDNSTFGTIAGVKAQEAGGLLVRLNGLRLVYPDGTINPLAAQFLQAIIMSKLPKRAK